MTPRSSPARGAARRGAARLRSLADPGTLHALVSNLKDGVYVSNLRGEVLDCNEAFLQLMGIASLDDLRSTTAFDLFVDPDRRLRELELLARDGSVREFEFRVRRPDGALRTVIDTCSAVREEESDEMLYLGILVDISDRKRMEDALRQSEEQYRALISQSAEAIYVLQDEHIVLVNPAWERLFGWTQEEVAKDPLPYLSVVAPESRQMVAERMKRVRNGSSVEPRYEMRGQNRDGTTMDLAVSVAEVEWRDRPARQGIYHDVTAIKKAHAELRRTLSLLGATLDSTADGLLVVNRDGRVETYNRKFLEMWRIPAEIANSNDDRRMLDFVVGQLKDPEAFLRRVEELYASPEAESYEELEFKDGRFFERYSTPQRIEGEPVGRVWSFRDVTERKRAEMRLVHDAFHDALTGLANRALFADLVARSIGRAQRRDDYTFALLFLDLDRFKVVNDSLGHAVGDQLLVAIARRLERCVRPGDTVARLGGDEFTVLLDDIEDVSDATRVAERVQRELNAPFIISGQEVFTSASIGIAVSTTGYERPDHVMRDADIAMYRAKATGKARYEIFDHAMHAHALTQLQLETDLRRAIDREEFRVVYQPILSLDSGRIIGFEALVRWQHPQRGLLLPDEFVPAAEDTGLIVPIGRVVLREACRQIAEWQRQFPCDPPLTMSVNFSAKQCRQPDLTEQIERLLGAWELPAESLCLEITESVLIDNADAAIELMARLRRLGVCLALDDFGTGYSSLGYLYRFDLTAIKVDRSFVADLGHNGHTVAIVRSIVGLARSLGMEVIAEGTERPEQLAVLRTLGCELVQGFLYAAPLAAEGARALLRQEGER